MLRKPKRKSYCATKLGNTIVIIIIIINMLKSNNYYCYFSIEIKTTETDVRNLHF